MKEKILRILTEAEDYVSGEALSKELGVSRTAIWKAVNRLKEEGYEIASVRNKGYRIEKQTSELVEDALKLHMPKGSLFETVRVLPTVDSTNAEAKRLWQSGHDRPALIVAREQTKGRGRRGRQWSSPMDQGIFMSMLLMPDIEPAQASMLTLVAGLAVSEAIEVMTGLQVSIKWPNDLVADSRKLSGILTEMSAEVDFVHHVIVGIGINVNQESFPDELETMATSLRLMTGKEINRAELIGKISELFEQRYSDFLEAGDLTRMIDAYNKRCINVGKDLKVLTRQDEIICKGVAVQKDGTLQVALEDGTLNNIHSGEVSVRGLYGYV